MKELIIKKDGEYVVSHKNIATYTGYKERSVSKLITDNIEDLEFFGQVRFKIATKKKIFFLNEQQSTLLITYMRNNWKVKQFKKNLVKGFYELQHKVLTQQEIIYQLQIEKNKLMQQYCPNTFSLETNEVLYDNGLHKGN